MEIRKFVAQTDQDSKWSGSVEAKEDSGKLISELRKLELLQEDEVIAGVEIQLQEKRKTYYDIKPVFTINAYLYESKNNQGYTEALRKDASIILRKRSKEVNEEYLGIFLQNVSSDCSILFAKDSIHGKLIQCSLEES